ncbi:MAG: hypothetical protein JRH11_04810 [Deltaproteobacteria bacterium]|nr:hypothetical protein [Deltaproteobacteria bacterium]
MKTILLTLAIALASISVGTGAAEAQRAVTGEVLVILAKEEDGTVDPALRAIAALGRPPFDAFSSMTILSRPTVSLRLNQATTVELPNGRRLQLILQQVMPDGRFRVRVSINRPEQNDYLPLLQVVASPGDPFFVAGQRHEGGTLVIGVRVGTTPPAAQAAPPTKNAPPRPAMSR